MVKTFLVGISWKLCDLDLNLGPKFPWRAVCFAFLMLTGVGAKKASPHFFLASECINFNLRAQQHDFLWVLLFFLTHRLLLSAAPVGCLRWHFPPRQTMGALTDVVYVSGCAFFFLFFFFNQTQTLCIFIPNLSLQRPSCPAIKERQPKPGPSVVPSFSLFLNDRKKTTAKAFKIKENTGQRQWTSSRTTKIDVWMRKSDSSGF